jgi:uncharacterized protein (TIGR03382 family)
MPASPAVSIVPSTPLTLGGRGGAGLSRNRESTQQPLLVGPYVTAGGPGFGDTDGDGVPDSSDSDPNDPNKCGDSDADGCDDCSTGHYDPAGDCGGSGTGSDGGCCDSGRNAGGAGVLAGFVLLALSRRRRSGVRSRRATL